MNKVLFSHNTDNWKTPKEIYNYFIIEKNCTDPCPYMSKEDNLNKVYNKDLYINPPYSQIDLWVDFIIKQLQNNDITIYLLIPVRTDTKYFHKLMAQQFHYDLYFIKGRLKFSDKQGAPFPSLLIKITNHYPLINCKFITQKELLNI